VARSIVALTAVVLLAAACSSSKSSTGSSSSSTAAQASRAGGGGGATGSPILVGSEIPLVSSVYNQPDAKTGLQAAVDAVNASGGVKGHPLKLEVCDTTYTVNGELSCARTLVADKVSAVIDPYILADQSGAEYTLFAQAGIAVFGSQGLSPAELNNPDVYPLGSGIPGWAYGTADQMLKAGATKITILITNDPVSEFIATLIEAAVKSGGKSATTVVGDANSDPTFATAAAKATAGGVNGVILQPAPAALPKIITALKQSDYSGKIGVLSVSFPQAVIDALGAAANGVLVDSQAAFTTDTANTGVAKFIADMKKYGDNTVTDPSLFSWSSVELFAQAISAAATFDSAAIATALKSVSAPINIGTIGPWQSAGVTSPLPSFNRILNPTVDYGVVTNGKVVADGKGFVNPFTSLTSG
jgi:ABC-type branched-subunit amino acid transport system substrate-binding protein